MSKVLYIAGWGRSGSTLLDQVLGDPEGWFSCGQLQELWRDIACGCGTSVATCPFWTRILDRAGPGYPVRTRPLWPGGIRRGYVGDSSLWDVACIRLAGRGRPDARTPQRRHAEVLTRLYGLIAEETGARVIVDSSKIATNAYLMAAITDLDLYVVHLVRDPRAVAHSWRRAKGPDPTGRTSLEEIGPMRSSREWLRRNAIAEICGHRLPPSRYMRVRYEDLTADPSGVIRAIRAFAGEPGGDRFVDTGTVRLGSNHMIGGNPRRFETGEIEIRPDSAWTTTMSTRNRALATLPALPLMRRYGYRSTL